MNINNLMQTYRDGLLQDTVPFWTRHSPDYRNGGFYTFLDRDGSLWGTDKPVWLQGRLAWVYSVLYNRVERRREWLDLSRHAVDFLLKHCFDSDGRAFFLVTEDGRPLRKRRYVLSEVCAVKGLRRTPVPRRPTRCGARREGSTCCARPRDAGAAGTQGEPGRRPRAGLRCR